VKCDEMAKKAIECVANGELKIIPDYHIATWNRWMGEIRDWCVSRQLWWGHRIPAYYIVFTAPGMTQGSRSDDNFWVCAHDEEEAKKKAAARFNVPEEVIAVHQDEDVLDTWFSSGMWPFSLMGWPEQTKDMEHFFPGSLLETGHDIIFFWVARMVFMSEQLCGKLPFYEVFLHAMVRDAHGRKMSKSLGNVIDPLDVIHGISLADLNKKLESGNLDPKELADAQEGQRKDYPDGIPECGTDALRFALMAYTTQGRDINLDVLRVEGYRRFCNKIWQGTRFSLSHLKDFIAPAEFKLSGLEEDNDLWILSMLSECVQSVDQGFISYRFQEVTTALHKFWLYEFCDVYLESVKSVLYSDNSAKCDSTRQVLYHCLESFLRLLAPFMPFICEELWQHLPKRPVSFPSVCVAEYPEPEMYPFRNKDLESRLAEGVEDEKKLMSYIKKAFGVKCSIEDQ